MSVAAPDNNLTANDLVANAATERPKPNKKPLTDTACQDLLRDIDALLNGGEVDPRKYGNLVGTDGKITKSIAQRITDLLLDQDDLYNRKPTGQNSYEGHRNALKQQQKALSSAIANFERACSKDGMTDEQKKLLDKAKEAVRQPVPEKPNSKIKEIVDKGPLYFLQRGAQEIFNVLKATGEITVAVILAILAAIAAGFGLGIPQTLDMGDRNPQMVLDPRSVSIQTAFFNSSQISQENDGNTLTSQNFDRLILDSTSVREEGAVPIANASSRKNLSDQELITLAASTLIADPHNNFSVINEQIFYNIESGHSILQGINREQQSDQVAAVDVQTSRNFSRGIEPGQ